MFWIYGGGFQFGAASEAFYDGSSFAAYEDVLLVSFNYRTNCEFQMLHVANE
jgi:acetylcholinesterase